MSQSRKGIWLNGSVLINLIKSVGVDSLIVQTVLNINLFTLAWNHSSVPIVASDSDVKIISTRTGKLILTCFISVLI